MSILELSVLGGAILTMTRHCDCKVNVDFEFGLIVGVWSKLELKPTLPVVRELRIHKPGDDSSSYD